MVSNIRNNLKDEAVKELSPDLTSLKIERKAETDHSNKVTPKKSPRSKTEKYLLSFNKYVKQNTEGKKYLQIPDTGIAQNTTAEEEDKSDGATSPLLLNKVQFSLRCFIA